MAKVKIDLIQAGVPTANGHIYPATLLKGLADTTKTPINLYLHPINDLPSTKDIIGKVTTIIFDGQYLNVDIKLNKNNNVLDDIKQNKLEITPTIVGRINSKNTIYNAKLHSFSIIPKK